MSLFKRLDTVIIRVRDLEKAKDWYTEVLEMEVGFESNEGEKIAVLNVGEGTPITLYELKEGEIVAEESKATSYPIFYPENIDDTYEVLTNRGVSLSRIEDDGGTRFFSFRDLDGNYLEVCYFD